MSFEVMLQLLTKELTKFKTFASSEALKPWALERRRCAVLGMGGSTTTFTPGRGGARLGKNDEGLLISGGLNPNKILQPS
jgi:hypothetical protein